VDLIQTVPRRLTRQATAALMRHPGVAMILATGGTAMVKAAYSSGTPAIGVGPGNAPAWICADADVEEAVPGPYGREKLAPILSLFAADGQDDGIRLCQQILGNGGRGHTAIIHTRSQQLPLSFARQMPVSRILVNGSGAHGCIGLGGTLTPSLTLGCGTDGGTSTTDNITYTHLVNIKRVAHPLADAGVLPQPDPTSDPAAA
jgi:acyl-CoA reductase-like NAD-dependent aldehyde dehydrogenase